MTLNKNNSQSQPDTKNLNRNRGKSWDFRDKSDIEISELFETRGFVIKKADKLYVDKIKNSILTSLYSYLDEEQNEYKEGIALEDIHEHINSNQANDIRLHVMNAISKNTLFNQNYYNAARTIIEILCGNELAMQKRPGLSINFPNNSEDVLPIHADTWNGVSPYELNIWIPLVDCKKSMCLYILEKESYEKKRLISEGLLRLSSDEIYSGLKEELTWIEINYGDVLAFDQSLPHGFCLNGEAKTHWSLNCRFKGLHTPYWDKKLGEYFMPINVKSCTRIGMSYKHPREWL